MSKNGGIVGGLMIVLACLVIFSRMRVGSGGCGDARVWAPFSPKKGRCSSACARAAAFERPPGRFGDDAQAGESASERARPRKMRG